MIFYQVTPKGISATERVLAALKGTLKRTSGRVESAQMTLKIVLSSELCATLKGTDVGTFALGKKRIRLSLNFTMIYKEHTSMT